MSDAPSLVLPAPSPRKTSVSGSSYIRHLVSGRGADRTLCNRVARSVNRIDVSAADVARGDEDICRVCRAAYDRGVR